MRPRLWRDLQVVLWVVDWVACVGLTRAHHPTTTIAMIATACLIGSCAVAVYVDALSLKPRIWRAGHRVEYAIMLIVTIAGSAAFGVTLIQVVYDIAWGPDPARYGLGFNLATDSLAVAIHVAVAKGIVWICGRGA